VDKAPLRTAQDHGSTVKLARANTHTSTRMKGRCQLCGLHKADFRLDFWDTVQRGLGAYYLRDSALPDPARVPQDERPPAAHRIVQARIDSPQCSWGQGKESGSARARAERIQKVR